MNNRKTKLGIIILAILAVVGVLSFPAEKKPVSKSNTSFNSDAQTLTSFKPPVGFTPKEFTPIAPSTLESEVYSGRPEEINQKLDKMLDAPDQGSINDINRAIKDGAMADSISLNDQTPLNSLTLSNMLVRVIEVVKNESIDKVLSEKKIKVKPNPFIDVSDANVTALFNLGIISDNDKHTFSPTANVTRQELASDILKTARVIGIDTTPTFEWSLNSLGQFYLDIQTQYSDSDANDLSLKDTPAFGNDTINGVAYCTQEAIMQGNIVECDVASSTSKTGLFHSTIRLFNPAGIVTNRQAYTILSRFYKVTLENASPLKSVINCSTYMFSDNYIYTIERTDGQPLNSDDWETAPQSVFRYNLDGSGKIDLFRSKGIRFGTDTVSFADSYAGKLYIAYGDEYLIFDDKTSDIQVMSREMFGNSIGLRTSIIANDGNQIYVTAFSGIFIGGAGINTSQYIGTIPVSGSGNQWTVSGYGGFGAFVDGAYLYFVNPFDAYLYKIKKDDGTGAQKVFYTGNNGLIYVNGDLYRIGNDDFSKINFDGNVEKMILNWSDRSIGGDIEYDDGYFYFDSGSTSNDNLQQNSIYRMKPDGSDLELIVSSDWPAGVDFSVVDGYLYYGAVNYYEQVSQNNTYKDIGHTLMRMKLVN